VTKVDGGMKIAMISTQVLATPPAGYGGLERVAHDLVETLSAWGHEVDLFAAPGSKKPPNGNLYVGPIMDPTKPNPDPDMGAFLSWTRPPAAVDWSQYDIVHENSWSKPSFLLRQEGINPRWLTTLHGPSLGTNAVPAVHPNIVGISATHAAALTEQLKQQARMRGYLTSPHTVKFVHNGIDFDAYPLVETKEDFAVWLNRFESYKGLADAMEACRKARVNLVIAGGTCGTNPNHVKEVKEKAEYLGFAFQGEVDQGTKVKLLSNAKVNLCPFALTPQWNETMGLVPIEAAACGTPTLAYASGGLTESVEHGVTGYHVTNVQDMTERLKDLFNGTGTHLPPPSLIRERSKMRFSRDVMAREYVRLYERLRKDPSGW
jgi:glycosyltransferase involved in cell wall biosynthesis